MISASKTQITYQCDGVTTQFSFPYAYYDKSHVVGFLIDGAGKETKITTNCDFDEVNKKFIYPVSGTAIAAPNKIKLKRVTELSQLLDLPDEHPYGNIEKAQDKLTMIMQEVTYVGEASIPEIEESLREQLNNVIDYKIAAENSAITADASATSANESSTDAQIALASLQDTVDVAVSNATQAATISAQSAAVSAALAQAAEAPAYSAAITYNFPDVVAFTDGYAYRCVGANVTGQTPDASAYWVRQAMFINDFFDVDNEGGYMPSLLPNYSSQFDLDANGDIEPK